jgi:Skp family chaperone for outer membrane proteins
MKNKNSEKYKKFLESEWYKKHSEKTPKHLIRTTEEKNKIYKMNKILKVKSHFFHNL